MDQHKILVTGLLLGNARNILDSTGYSVLEIHEWHGDRLYEMKDEEKHHIKGVFCYLTDRIDRSFLDQFPNLKAISLCAAGYDSVSLAECRARGIQVTHTPGVLTDATADLTLALILCGVRRLVPSDSFCREGKFHGWRPDLFLGMDLTGKTLGLLGLGKIGKAVADRARSFKMKIIALKRNGHEDKDVEFVSLEDLFCRSDILSLHCPLTPQTRGIVSKERLRSMKRTSWIINTARGALIDEAALVKALQEGAIAGACLDVFQNEPAIHPDLLKMKNVVLSPHIGSATTEVRERMCEMAAVQLKMMLQGADAIENRLV